jgi:hypothetical protein
MTDKLLQLAALGLWALEETRAENLGGDLDGGAVQDKAESLGLLHNVEVTEDCGGDCVCVEYGEFPQQCLRATYDAAAVREALAAHDAALAAPVEPTVEPALRRLLDRFVKWKHCMSYNDSYFTEPPGELKRIAYEIDRLLGAPAEPAPAPADERQAFSEWFQAHRGETLKMSEAFKAGAQWQAARASPAAEPKLVEGMQAVPCAVQLDPAHPQHGWLFIPHVDGQWVSAFKLVPFSQKIIEHWLIEAASRGKPQPLQEGEPG